MRQLLQDIRGGETQLVDVPAPVNHPGCLLIQSVSSLVSLGTEKMMINFGKANWINKARQQPDKVRQVLEKARVEGLFTTFNAVNAKLDQAIPLGYSNVGRIISVGKGVDGFSDGDLVVSNGPHAEIVSVEKNLVVRIPDSISSEEACFSVVGSIGLQGIRLLEPTIGECFVVTGLGLIGLLSVQILRANGCRVIGLDYDSKKCNLARQLGADVVDMSKGEDPIDCARKLTEGRGIDGVLITASTTSNDPVHQGALMCRKRGRIVLVGVTGLELSRADFYEKELSFQVSCSYGPGRYDTDYETKGQDYPLGFVRWTENRNIEAVLELIGSERIDVKPLISHRFAFGDALNAYEQISSGGALGIILKYRDDSEFVSPERMDRRVELGDRSLKVPSNVVVGVIGAGGFTRQVLLPSLARTSSRLKTIVSSKGVSGTQLGRKFGFECSSTDIDSVFSDQEINTVVITTRHNTHTSFVLKAMESGKGVFVEKPLCLNWDELEEIEKCYQDLRESGEKPLVMVGFNRRFAPQVVKMKQLLASTTEPKAMTMIVNAGFIPSDHWIQDEAIGGGRIVGEGCHFIDLLRYLADSRIADVKYSYCADPGRSGLRDCVTILLEFENGSTGTIQYLSNGNKAVSKERLDVYCGGKVLILDNFLKLRGYGWKGFSKMNLWRQDKGHAAELVALVHAVKAGKEAPIPFEDIIEVTKASFIAAGLLRADKSRSVRGVK
jgi:predicted dehydrogenase/NADPH:quinone reductase-like Zn-dependent oxidoreductase